MKLYCTPVVRVGGAIWKADRFSELPAQHEVGSLGSKAGFRDSSRKLGLNDYLIGIWQSISSAEECLLKALAWNAALPRDYACEPLDEDTVKARAQAVWADIEAGELTRMRSQRATLVSDGDEIRALGATRLGRDALYLLALFRTEHDARHKRGEAFRICLDRMKEAGTLGDMSIRRARAACRLLLDLGLIRIVKPAQGLSAAQYDLTSRRLTPSLGTLRQLQPRPADPTVNDGSKDRHRKRRSADKPWAAAGMARSTYYRKRRARKAER